MTLVADKSLTSNESNDIKDAVIRLAGNSQDGIQTIGGFLARLAGRSAQDVMTYICLLYTSPSPRDRTRSRMPSSA